MITIGIDPGTTVTGYAVIRDKGNGYEPIDYGCIRPPPRARLSDRYLIIYEGLQSLLDTHAPDEMAIESQFMHKNPQSTLKLGIANGLALIAAKQRKMRIYTYSPQAIKRAVVGTGKATKPTVQAALTRLLCLSRPPEPLDASDALAIALCHATTPEHYRKEI